MRKEDLQLNSLKSNNAVDNKYRLKENGFTYIFDFEMIKSIEAYYEAHINERSCCLANWYRSLSPEEKRKVIMRAGDKDLENYGHRIV